MWVCFESLAYPISSSASSILSLQRHNTLGLKSYPQKNADDSGWNPKGQVRTNAKIWKVELLHTLAIFGMIFCIGSGLDSVLLYLDTWYSDFLTLDWWIWWFPRLRSQFSDLITMLALSRPHFLPISPPLYDFFVSHEISQLQNVVGDSSCLDFKRLFSNFLEKSMVILAV